MPEFYTPDTPGYEYIRHPFIAKITAVADNPVTPGTWTYEWIEQAYGSDGLFIDAESGRSGDVISGPYLVELNNIKVDVPNYVRIQLRGVVNGQYWYDFDHCCASIPNDVLEINFKDCDGNCKCLTLPAWLGATLTDGPCPTSCFPCESTTTHLCMTIPTLPSSEECDFSSLVAGITLTKSDGHFCTWFGPDPIGPCTFGVVFAFEEGYGWVLTITWQGLFGAYHSASYIAETWNCSAPLELPIYSQTGSPGFPDTANIVTGVCTYKTFTTDTYLRPHPHFSTDCYKITPGIVTDCCDDGIPTTLIATVTSDACPCLAGDYTLTWDLVGHWRLVDTPTTCPNSGYGLLLNVSCDSAIIPFGEHNYCSAWVFGINCEHFPGGYASGYPTSCTCDPFSLTYHLTWSGTDCCGDGSSITVVIHP